MFFLECAVGPDMVVNNACAMFAFRAAMMRLPCDEDTGNLVIVARKVCPENVGTDTRKRSVLVVQVELMAR